MERRRAFSRTGQKKGGQGMKRKKDLRFLKKRLMVPLRESPIYERRSRKKRKEEKKTEGACSFLVQKLCKGESERRYARHVRGGNI